MPCTRRVRAELPTIIIHGLDQLQRDFARMGPATSKAMRFGLREAAEPVARTAEQFSLSQIRRMPRSPQWAQTRIGSTLHEVYIVPKQRGVKSGRGDDPRRRPNLVELMMGRSFEPALEVCAPIVEATVARFIGEVIR